MHIIISCHFQFEGIKIRFSLTTPEISGLRSISHVIIQTKSGLPLFNIEFQSFAFDTILISGMTSAISNALSGLKSSTSVGFEIMERQDLTITSHRSELSNFIVISNDGLPSIMMNQIESAHEAINKKYSNVFEESDTGYEGLDNLDVLKIFIDNGFKLDLLLQFKINTTVLTKILSDEINLISGKIRQYLNMLYDFQDTYGKDHLYTMNRLFTYYDENEVGAEMTSSIIRLLYERYCLTPVLPDE